VVLATARSSPDVTDDRVDMPTTRVLASGLRGSPDVRAAEGAWAAMPQAQTCCGKTLRSGPEMLRSVHAAGRRLR
jgi:hypothetical protein